MRPYTPIPRCGRGAGGEGKKACAPYEQRTQVLYPYQRPRGGLGWGLCLNLTAKTLISMSAQWSLVARLVRELPRGLPR